jgi:hypothetical protein
VLLAYLAGVLLRAISMHECVKYAIGNGALIHFGLLAKILTPLINSQTQKRSNS